MNMEQCHAAGMTQADTAKHLGVHRCKVQRWAKKTGASFAKYKMSPDAVKKLHDARDNTLGRIKWTPELDAMWNSDMPRTEIAEKMGVSISGIGKLAAKLGKSKRYRVSTTAQRDKAFEGLTDAQMRDVNTLLNAGYSIRDAVATVTTPKVKIRATPAYEARA